MGPVFSVVTLWSLASVKPATKVLNMSSIVGCSASCLVRPSRLATATARTLTSTFLGFGVRYENSLSIGSDIHLFFTLVRSGEILIVRCTGPTHSGVGLHSSGRG